MPFRLRHLQHNFELLRGEFVIGRSAECQLALDDPLVSRKHAVLLVSDETVTIRDLGSRNGVAVNGEKIAGPRVLGDGDRIGVGSQEMTLLTWKPISEPLTGARQRLAMQTLSGIPVVHDRGEAVRESTNRRIDSLALLSGLADKALALGRPDDAERILANTLQEILRELQAHNPVPTETVELAAQYAIRLAGATAKGSWVDYIMATYTCLRRPLPAAIVDELHLVIRKIASVDVATIRAYVEILRDSSGSYGPAERFLVQRIEGLERLASLR